VARNRQRAKQRREARLAERGSSGANARQGDGAARARTDAERVERERAHEEQERLDREADLEAGAPPQDLGFPGDTLEHGPHLDEAEDDREALAALDEDVVDDDFDWEDEAQPVDGAAAREPARGPKGVRGARSSHGSGEATHKGRGRLIAFFIAVWAELKRVQWPDRKQLTQMTSIVLVFVLIAGGYLGLLDAIFSKIIKAIL
jgi:preprotein translocase SecE subunit